ncbi:DUF3906 family protein [Salipaludibacillus daqingensis]|uniref:DUF3906 family protein n=1 Tax=Salipaludibacillus daqingensis TaxID=3041001 RepID=UPI002473F2EE|nr:DUF3906 family protein [Salipaludibacillus daqingensis]
MKLYRFEARVNRDHDVAVIVVAESENEAFDAAEVELEKSYLKTPIIEELSLMDTRIVAKQAAFVIGYDEN